MIAAVQSKWQLSLGITNEGPAHLTVINMSGIQQICIKVASDVKTKPKTKVTVVGVGSVGMAIAFTVMTKSIANVLALIDADENKVMGEVLDMQQGSQFLDTCNVIGGKGWNFLILMFQITVILLIPMSFSSLLVSAKKRVNLVLILFSEILKYTNVPMNSSRMTTLNSEYFTIQISVVRQEALVLLPIVPQIVKYSPECVIVVVSNPVDILTHVTWKLSGFPQNRVIGSGTVLDSARFRHILGKKLNLAASSIHGYIIGEHGDSSVPVWSKVSIGGVHLSSVYPKMGEDDDPERFIDIHKSVVESAYEIIRLKGYTSWAIGLGCANLCHSLVHDRHVVLPVSTNVKVRFSTFYLLPLCLCNVLFVHHFSLVRNCSDP
ncbi:unnamed protein product [Dibothriocephalus latus]|uniref:L-lactate dehydrogenase n=1 Tax=Dibothriocephalus latus TaxID=60516 RepID=A0A3P6UH07_DIBLA|nr:unnamed protein product [Dibothriocephalus latus]